MIAPECSMHESRDLWDTAWLCFLEMLLKLCAVTYDLPVHSRCAVTCAYTRGLFEP